MKKRYLVKRYGLPAIILLFLLLWLSQQNAIDNNMLYGVLVERQSAWYDSPDWLNEDSQSFQHDRNLSRPDLLETKQHPSHGVEYHVSSRDASSSNISVNSQIYLDTGIKESKSQDLFDKNHGKDPLVHEKRSLNYSVGVLNEDTQQIPTADDEIDLNVPRVLELDVRKSVHENASDIMKHEFRSATDADNENDRKIVTRVPVHTFAEYRRTRPFKQLIVNDSAMNSHPELRRVPRINSRDQTFNFRPILPTVKAQTARQRVSSDDDADGSLILARQLALKNFVKTDEKHQPSDQSDDNNVRSRVSDILSVKASHPVQHKPLFDDIAASRASADSGRKQEMEELKKFAEVPAALPDYDLPILKEKTTNNRVVRNSTKKPDLGLRIGITAESYLVSNKTLTHVGEVSGLKLEDDEVLADTDDVMSSAVVLGDVNPNKTYAVFSTTTENRDALQFIFLLPLTALAWKRIGFDSIIIIIGPVDVWNSDELFHFVLSVVRQLDAIVVFLEPRPEKSVMISQVSRIFIANILRARAAVANRQHPDVIDGTYLVTSDTDIWPIYGDIYRLPTGRDILSLNSECCGAFSHRNVAYRMLPMANVGMRIGTWRRLTRRFGESPRTMDDILTAVVREFGPVALRPVHKGDNVGWFLDQMMVSLLVAEWTKRHGADRVKLIPRDVGVDRLDRNAWGPGDSNGIADKIDAHLLGNAYLPGVWAQIMPLVNHLYGFETDKYNWCVEYYDSFQKLFIAKYRSQNRVGDQ